MKLLFKANQVVLLETLILQVPLYLILNKIYIINVRI